MRRGFTHPEASQMASFSLAPHGQAVPARRCADASPSVLVLRRGRLASSVRSASCAGEGQGQGRCRPDTGGDGSAPRAWDSGAIPGAADDDPGVDLCRRGASALDRRHHHCLALRIPWRRNAIHPQATYKLRPILDRICSRGCLPVGAEPTNARARWAPQTRRMTATGHASLKTVEPRFRLSM